MDALIYCNGERLSKSLFRDVSEHTDFYIGADGGAYHLLCHGVSPDVIIGDLDSFKLKAPEETKLLKSTDQETNDLEKALLFAEEEKMEEVLIAGATGLRLDHTLKNISVLLQFQGRFKSLKLIDDFGFHFIAEKNLKLKTRLHQIVSLFPVSGKVNGITTKGLKYPLKNETLQNGVRDGSSNEATGEEVEINFSDGALLISVSH